MTKALLLYCRPGFEKDCLAELTYQASEIGAFGWANLEMNSGFVVYETDHAEPLYRRWNHLVFTRDCWPIYKRLEALDPNDRLSAIVEAVRSYVADHPNTLFGDVSCEFAEGDDYRATAKFSGKFVHPVRQALRKIHLLTHKEDRSKPALRLFFKDSSQVAIGVDHARQRALWPMGIARLKFPPSAPSRSTLKLEEGLAQFLGANWRDALDDCHTGVDLGASPGGWTWQLVNQKIHVYAIDNGPMDAKLMSTGLVEHVTEDGFVWTPKNSVDVLVCDMIEKPNRVAQLMFDWLHHRHAKFAIFNLKLPMKKRFQQWLQIKDGLDGLMTQYPNAVLKAKHLYHDREEITVYLDLRNQHG